MDAFRRKAHFRAVQLPGLEKLVQKHALIALGVAEARDKARELALLLDR